MKKPRKATLAELREGRPILSYGNPAEWLVAAVGQEAAEAAVLFGAEAVELSEGVTIRLLERPRKEAA
jgi:hypothetical protein